MNPHPSKVVVALLATAVLGLAATGCSGGGKKDTAQSAKGDSAAGRGTGGGATTGTAATGSPAGGDSGSGSGSPNPSGKPSDSDRCHTADLRADIQIQPDHPGSAMLMLVNKGTRTCTVYGYAGLGGLLADNSPVVVGTTRVPQPGPPTRTTLKPGTTAFAGLAWASCSKSDPDCKVLAGLTLTPPDETTQVIASVLGTDGKPVNALAVSAAGIRVGSLQPSHQGVLLP
ncbi:DUF4232 domain-containing protein [Kitasatospora sp. NPDC088346]|uniref:DUF4232 domain-containing protein n=1 Tax=Kitasatospora sp. NPDC088346 TaxID=3364073 RepID=UPI0037FD411A